MDPMNVEEAGQVLRSLASDSALSTLDVGYRTEDSENTSKVESKAPETPQKSSRPVAVTPLTPTANLKVLVAAAEASSARDKVHSLNSWAKGSTECEGQGSYVDCDGVESEGGGDDDLTGRKTKSLAVLCKKFLSIAETDVGVGIEFSLETMASSLGTNRRRIYDIINVLESLEMIMKQSKNWYMWLGRECLLVTLAKLKAMARDDHEFRYLYDFESAKENTFPNLSVGIPPVSDGFSGVEAVCCEESVQCGSRWDKSLGVLCQKFVMLFLITPYHEVTLDCAGNILMPDTYDPVSGQVTQAPTNSKTKVRRLYDIANVLTTLGLIKKKTFLAPNHRKMPGYTWCGPSQEEIDAISVTRKNEFPLYSLYPVRKLATPHGPPSGTQLSRKPSLGKNRPFLHQYEVKGQQKASSQPSSAPGTPIKSKESGFKRSLSFGGGINPRQLQGTGFHMSPVVGNPSVSGVTAGRRLAPKDYVKEIYEFETEMLRHSHKYPHVVPIFREFVQKYKANLSAVSGRSILPKPSPMATHSDGFKPYYTSSPPVVTATNERTGLEDSSLTAPKTSSESPDDKMVSVNSQTCADDMFPNNFSQLAGQRSMNEPVAKRPSKEMNFTCMEVLPTNGYSKSLSVCVTADSHTGPQSKTTGRLVAETSQNNKSGAVLSEVQTPHLVTTALLSSLVNQQPISVSAETTTRSVSSNLLPDTIKGLSAILAGQIATCLQAKPDTLQMRNQIPVSQLSSMFSTSQTSSSRVRVPLGVVQGHMCVPSLSGKSQLKKGSDTENFVSPSKRPRLEV